MTKSSYGRNGFTLSGIREPLGTITAHYDRSGALMGCEIVDGRGISRPIPSAWGSIRANLLRIGLRNA